MPKILPFSPAKARAPNTVNRKIPPGRPRNSDVKTREHLTAREVDRLIQAAGKQGRHGYRDGTLVLIM